MKMTRDRKKRGFQLEYKMKRLETLSLPGKVTMILFKFKSMIPSEGNRFQLIAPGEEMGSVFKSQKLAHTSYKIDPKYIDHIQVARLQLVAKGVVMPNPLEEISGARHIESSIGLELTAIAQEVTHVQAAS